jgi:hypothetical protein
MLKAPYLLKVNVFKRAENAGGSMDDSENGCSV